MAGLMLARLFSRPKRISLRSRYVMPLLAVLAVAGMVLLVREAIYVLGGRNFFPVIPDRVYRSAQLKPGDLGAILAEHRIRTVVNLRGCCDSMDWYLAEAATAAGAGVHLEDISLSAIRLPPPAELRQLLDVLDRADYPLLIHCRQGIDRTGLVSAFALLLFTDASVSRARQELSLRHGHVSIGPTAPMHAVLDYYEEWLDRQRVEHQPELLRHWLRHEYCPGPARAELTLLDEPVLRKGQGRVLRLRARNDAIEPWQLYPGRGSGIHARFVLAGMDGQVLHVGFAGLFKATVLVGESIELKLGLPPVEQPGRYALMVDLLDGRSRAFSQAGSPPWIGTVDIRE